MTVNRNITSFDINRIKRENLRRIMNEHRLTPTTLAELVGKKQSHISACLNGGRNIGDKTIEAISAKLNIDKGEFYHIETIGISESEKIQHPIPIIPWVNVMAFAGPMDQWPVGGPGEGEPVFSNKKVGSHSFGLRIEEDSMAPRFLPGDIIIVDPEIRSDNGSACVVLVNGEVSLKLFYEDKREVRLVPMNETHEIRVIPKDRKVDFRVIGKVVDLIPKL